MSKCSYCGIDFPLLLVIDKVNEANVRCGKCTLRVPGLSIPELAAVNDKLQCAGCGLASNLIKHPLCNGCIKTYKQAQHIPTSILKIQGVAALLLEQNTTESMGSNVSLTDGASAIISSAQGYQARASDPRLNKPSTARGAEGGLNKINFKLKNIAGKAQVVAAERKAKREEANLVGVGIKVGATLWKVPEHGKMAKIEPIRVVHVFSPETETKEALSALLQLVRKSFVGQYPDTNPLTWENISIYAHETQQKYSSLEYFDQSLSMDQFYREFVKGKLVAETMLKDKKIEVRFAFFENKVFRDGYQNSAESYRLPSHSKASSAFTSKASSVFTKPSSSVGSKAKKQRTDDMMASVAPVLALGSKHQVYSLNSRATASGGAPFTFAIPDVPQHALASGRIVLKSAFRPATGTVRPKWTRNIKMVTCSFLRTKVTYALEDGLNVHFETSEISEEIQIAARWECVDDDGYIGEGFTKRGIYARFRDKEYVLTQPVDPQMTHSAVRSVMEAEYALLCVGNTLKHEFDKHARVSGIHTTIPTTYKNLYSEFYFNFEGSILGSLIPSLSSQSRHLTHRIFIATPLLPCGELDGKIKKFTGNDEFGDPEDHLTRAIHAFAHFTAVYTQQNIIFCDLQGMFDNSKVMCLIDPQGHTATHDNSCHEYWDGGPKKIQDLLKKHSTACENNWICQALNLRDAIVEEKESSANPSSYDDAGDQAAEKSLKRKRRGNLSFLINSES